MIYELSVVTKPELGSEAHAQMTEIVKDALKVFAPSIFCSIHILHMRVLKLFKPFQAGTFITTA